MFKSKTFLQKNVRKNQITHDFVYIFFLKKKIVIIRRLKVWDRRNLADAIFGIFEKFILLAHKKGTI